MSDDTNDASQKPARTSTGLLIAVGLVLMPVLYVLSIGPVVWMLSKTGIGAVPGVGPSPIMTALTYFYLPLEWVVETETPPAYWLRLYVEWWRGP